MACASGLHETMLSKNSGGILWSGLKEKCTQGAEFDEDGEMRDPKKKRHHCVELIEGELMDIWHKWRAMEDSSLPRYLGRNPKRFRIYLRQTVEDQQFWDSLNMVHDSQNTKWRIDNGRI